MSVLRIRLCKFERAALPAGKRADRKVFVHRYDDFLLVHAYGKIIDMEERDRILSRE